MTLKFLSSKTTSDRRPSRNAILVGGALAAALTAGMAQSAAALEVPQALARMTPSQVADRVEVRDDPLEDHVTFSTRPVIRKGSYKDGVSVHDGYVKAFKPRDSAATEWRVSHHLTFFGARRDVNLIHIRSGGKLLKIEPATVRRWSEECSDNGVTCGQHMSVEFKVPEETIREIAAAYKPGDRTPWPVRFKDGHGRDFTVSLAPSEVAGLVSAVDTWKR